jgi:tRNA pseudouridine55 synthase
VNARPPKKPRDLVDGVLLLDKPVGLSSNDALIKAKRVMNAKKAGHTGTLDPFATGLLPLCFGEATKFSQDLLEADKTYLADVHLGVSTTTGDTEGETVETRPVDVTVEQIEAALARSADRSCRCRRCIPRSSATARPCTNMRAKASCWSARRVR